MKLLHSLGIGFLSIFLFGVIAGFAFVLSLLPVWIGISIIIIILFLGASSVTYFGGK